MAKKPNIQPDFFHVISRGIPNLFQQSVSIGIMYLYFEVSQEYLAQHYLLCWQYGDTLLYLKTYLGNIFQVLLAPIMARELEMLSQAFYVQLVVFFLRILDFHPLIKYQEKWQAYSPYLQQFSHVFILIGKVLHIQCQPDHCFLYWLFFHQYYSPSLSVRQKTLQALQNPYYIQGNLYGVILLRKIREYVIRYIEYAVLL